MFILVQNSCLSWPAISICAWVHHDAFSFIWTEPQLKKPIVRPPLDKFHWVEFLCVAHFPSWLAKCSSLGSHQMFTHTSRGISCMKTSHRCAIIRWMIGCAWNTSPYHVAFDVLCVHAAPLQHQYAQHFYMPFGGSTWSLYLILWCFLTLVLPSVYV